MVTLPAFTALMVTKHRPWPRLQTSVVKETDPVPPTCDHATVPVGKYPLTTAVHLITCDEPANVDAGLHDTAVLDAFAVTLRMNLPDEGEL